MEAVTTFVAEQPALAGALAVIIVLLTIMINNQNKQQSSAAAAATKDTSASNAKKNKKKKAAKQKKAAAAKANGSAASAPAPTPAAAEEEEEDPEPEPAPAPSKKKKKKKPEPAAIFEEPAPVVVEEPVVEEPEPTPVVEEEPTATTPSATSGSSKKKKKKKKNNNGAATASSTAEGKKVEPKADDEDDDDDEDALATFAKGSRDQRKKNGKSNDDDDWNVINKNKGKGKKAAAAVETAKTEEAAAEAGTDPAESKPEFLQMDITSEDIPTIIGPKGATIQQIQLETGTSVDIDKGFSVVKVKGDDEEKMKLALQRIRDIIDAKKAKTAHTATLSGEEIKGSDGVKAIIGKGGSMIKEIQSSTSCKIDADIDKGTVNIAGPSEAAVKEAVQKCKDAVFGASNCTMDLKSKPMVFCICGRNFGELQKLQTETGARLDMTGTVLTISGDVEKVQAAFSTISAKMVRCKGVSLVIDKNIGAVMGKGGSNIRQIQEKTGAFIDISQAGECKIVGEPDAVKAAETSVRKAMAGEIELKPGEVLEKVELGVGTSMVIGTGGSKIKELQKEHGVQINVQITMATLVGKKDAVAAAKTAILAIVTPLIERAKQEEEARKEAEKTVAAGDTTWTGDGKDDDADGW